MKTRSTLLLAAAALAVGVGIYGYSEYNRGVEDTSGESAVATLSAVQLVNEFVADENAANTKYTGKVLEVKGAVKSMDGNAVLLSGGTDDSEVSCTFDKTPKVAPAAVVTIKGECAGFDGLIVAQVQLVRCAIVE
ncbi:MAG: hypothetical protein WAU70_05385 [Flavobacteriales bacterium]